MFCLCVGIHVHACESQRTVYSSWFSFYPMGSGCWTQVSGVDSKHYHPLNHLSRPEALNTDVLCFGITFMWFFSFAHIKMLFIKWLQKEALVCRSYFVFSGNNTQWGGGKFRLTGTSLQLNHILLVYLWLYAWDLPEPGVLLNMVLSYFFEVLTSSCFDW